MSPKVKYKIFLQSDFWAKLRADCLSRDHHACKYCGNARKKLQAHHIVYPKDWYDTTIDMLITLCRDCHKREHQIQKILHKRHRKANMRKFNSLENRKKRSKWLHNWNGQDKRKSLANFEHLMNRHLAAHNNGRIIGRY